MGVQAPADIGCKDQEQLSKPLGKCLETGGPLDPLDPYMSHVQFLVIFTNLSISLSLSLSQSWFCMRKFSGLISSVSHPTLETPVVD